MAGLMSFMFTVIFAAIINPIAADDHDGGFLESQAFLTIALAIGMLALVALVAWAIRMCLDVGQSIIGEPVVPVREAELAAQPA